MADNAHLFEEATHEELEAMSPDELTRFYFRHLAVHLEAATKAYDEHKIADLLDHMFHIRTEVDHLSSYIIEGLPDDEWEEIQNAKRQEALLDLVRSLEDKLRLEGREVVINLADPQTLRHILKKMGMDQDSPTARRADLPGQYL